MRARGESESGQAPSPGAFPTPRQPARLCHSPGGCPARLRGGAWSARPGGTTPRCPCTTSWRTEGFPPLGKNAWHRAERSGHVAVALRPSAGGVRPQRGQAHGARPGHQAPGLQRGPSQSLHDGGGRDPTTVRRVRRIPPGAHALQRHPRRVRRDRHLRRGRQSRTARRRRHLAHFALRQPQSGPAPRRRKTDGLHHPDTCR